MPDWEEVLSAAARLQELLPDAVLVGGTASTIHAQHRFSRDADHVLPDLRERFDNILAQLESVAGWKTARVRRPVQILGSLDGIETGIRQLIREQPLETTVITCRGQRITVPTKEEILRIKGALILKRNATRDYLDFVALAEQLGDAKTARALRDFDRLYPQPNDESALQQLQIQLANPLPYDLEETRLREYMNLAPKWQ
ncbi:MAG TPA: nucleotidyl transferase AbiEii/AbiGii toxin family protein, partial [Verrucomicrobiota bacterium]|nr:nucleotidyl transferase AbiEii/AbiGii toxin family protein [Verrucomicrobiota bacterium]